MWLIGGSTNSAAENQDQVLYSARSPASGARPDQRFVFRNDFAVLTGPASIARVRGFRRGKSRGPSPSSFSAALLLFALRSLGLLASAIQRVQDFQRRRIGLV